MANRPCIGSAVRAGVMRLVLAALACAIALSTLVSAIAIAELHDHDCSGEGCPTCLVLEASQAALSLAVSPSLALSSFLALACFLVAAFATGWVFASSETLVSLKVRLVI